MKTREPSPDLVYLVVAQQQERALSGGRVRINLEGRGRLAQRIAALKGRWEELARMAPNGRKEAFEQMDMLDRLEDVGRALTGVMGSGGREPDGNAAKIRGRYLGKVGKRKGESEG